MVDVKTKTLPSQEKGIAQKALPDLRDKTVAPTYSKITSVFSDEKEETPSYWR